MITARRATLTLLAAFGACAVAAGAIMAWSLQVSLAEPAEAKFQGERTAYRVELLEMLRAGQTQELIDKLERKVDNYLGDWDRDAGNRGNARVEVAIDKVRAYRASYPRVTADPKKDAAVKRVLEKR